MSNKYVFNPFTQKMDVVPDVSIYCPYTGANADVDLGVYGITTTGTGTFGNLDVDTLNLNGNVITDSTGTISFDDEDISTTGKTITGGESGIGLQINEGSWIQIGSTDSCPTTSGIAFADWDGTTPNDAYVKIFESQDDDLELQARSVKLGNYQYGPGSYIEYDSEYDKLYASSGTFDFDNDDIITTGTGTFGSLDVDTLNFNGNVISDSTGTISFDDEDITTTGEATANRVNTDDYAVASDDFSYLASALLSGDARRGMLPLMMDLYSDALAFRGISALEYYDYGTTAWVAWGGETGQELLDGNSNTYFEADYTHRKWRITIHTNTYLMAGMVFCERSWDGNGAAGSGANGFDLTVETDTIAAFTSPTEKGTATYTTNTGTSVNSMLLINAHVNEAYWRFTFDGSATMDHADDVMLLHNLKMLTSGNLNRGTFRGNPWATSYDKTVTFEGPITTAEKGTFGALSIGATAGVDGSFTSEDGKTITVTKGLITAIV